MELEDKKKIPPLFWEDFIQQIASKTRSKLGTSRKLSRAISNALEKPEIYITLGVHGNILFSDIGYCEFDDPDRVWNFLQKWTKLSRSLPIGFEIGICSLENLAKIYPVWELFKEHGVEILNPTYSQPYLRHLGEESNIRQLQFGMDVLTQNGLTCNLFVSSEHALHPQLPQLLKGIGIEYVFATARLVGGAPTSYLPKVYWNGLDGTKIKCVVNQSGISNGQVWHGKFFQELSSLLFYAFSRPDLLWVLYENIEDVAYDFSEIHAINEHKNEFESSDIHFSKFQEIFSNPHPYSRSVQWSIEDFPLRVMNSCVIGAARKLEDLIVNQEACLSLILEYGIGNTQKSIDEIWKTLLVAQNHDAYVVPYITSGMYMMSQGLTTSFNPNGFTIEKKCLELLERAKSQLKSLGSMDLQLKNKYDEVYVNWLWEREILLGQKLITFPPCGYVSANTSKYTLKEFPSNGLQYLKNIMKWIDVPHIDQLIEQRKIEEDNLSIELEDHHSFLKLQIQSKKKIELSIRNCDELCITYPFGLQKTSETQGHSHRFFWVNKKFVLIHSGCPYFSRNEDMLKIFIPSGHNEIGIGYATSLKKAYHLAWEFFYPPCKIRVPKVDVLSKCMLSIKFNDFIPTSIRRNDLGLIVRGFCVGNNSPVIENSVPLDLIDKQVFTRDKKSPKSAKWKILSFLVKND